MQMNRCTLIIAYENLTTCICVHMCLFPCSVGYLLMELCSVSLPVLLTWLLRDSCLLGCDDFSIGE